MRIYAGIVFQKKRYVLNEITRHKLRKSAAPRRVSIQFLCAERSDAAEEACRLSGEDVSYYFFSRFYRDKEIFLNDDDTNVCETTILFS